jgi:predicted permease
MQALLTVILPVYFVIGAGYLAVWRKIITDDGIDGLMKFGQGVALPCLLFRAIWSLDLSQSFDAPLLISFYTGSVTCFAVGLLAAHYLFKRDWEDSVAIGFCGLFANSLVLGLPITERAFGPDALAANYAIIAVHSPICYAIGITAMEIVRAKDQSPLKTTGLVLRAMFRNALVLGILLGMTFNLLNVDLPSPVTDGLDLMIRGALPAVLFGLGGVLYRYRPEGDARVIAMICGLSLILHPAITWTLGKTFGLPTDSFRSAVTTASMAPGVNSYLFANMYGRAKRVAATSVLIATALSTLTIWFWLTVMP